MSWETENTSSYDPQPCTEKLGNEARQITKLLQFLGTKWAPRDKGPSRTLTDYKGLSSQTIISISLPAVFEWSLSADSCFETTSVTATRINLNKTENLQVTIFADVEGDNFLKTHMQVHDYQSVFSTKLFCILMNILHGRLLDLAHVIKSFRSPNNSDTTWWFLINVLIYGLNGKGKL